MKIVIIGGGPAALESAASARKVNADAEIAMYSAENSLPYRRPALSGLLAAGSRIDERSFFIKPAAFFDEQRIAFHPGRRAVAVEGGAVRFASGESENFDRLILACGSEAVRLPIPGAELPHVFTLRSFTDMKNINAKLDTGVGRAAVIGGGVLGLEVADSLLSRGIETTVLEAAPRLFPGRLSEEDSAALLSRLNALDHRLRILCGQCVSGITETAVTAGDDAVAADIVIMSAGSRPDLSLARSAGLECGRGVKTDETMRSSREDIFAAGDTAEYNGRCFNLYPDAVAGGRTAGTNAAGGEARFTSAVSPVRLNALGEKLVMP